MLRATTSTFLRKNVIHSSLFIRSTLENQVPSPWNEGVMNPSFTQVRTNRVTAGVTRKARHKKDFKRAK